MTLNPKLLQALLALGLLILVACNGGNDGTPSLKLFAGSLSGAGNVDGVGAAANFYFPSGLTTDIGGNVYVADLGNNTIRKITPAGVVTTFAGTGVAGSADGIGAAASFHGPRGVATDSAGNVYVADSDNSTIRKISADGLVTTFAGTAPTTGSTDGVGATASFNHPQGIATDTAGNVYVADTYNNTIRKITPTGAVTTVAGSPGVYGNADGTGASASFRLPTSITTDNVGNLYISDLGNDIIRKITSDGVVTTLAGTPGVAGSADGTGVAASFSSPEGVAIDKAGNIYVADTVNATIRKISPIGEVTTVAGSPGVSGSSDGAGTTARFYYPAGITTDSAGNVYVSDNSETIRKFSPDGAVTTIAGAAPVDGGSADGVGAAAHFFGPAGVAPDATGNVYVADTFNDTIRKITPDGVVTTFAGSPRVAGSADGTGAKATFQSPADVAIDSAGNVYVADSGNYTIRKITPNGVVTTFAGSPGVHGSADGTGAAVKFGFPRCITTDEKNNVYVVDYPRVIRKISPTGVVKTIANIPVPTGVGLEWFGGYGLGGITTDKADNIYVSDTDKNVILKITPDGVVTTLAGIEGTSGSTDGLRTLSSFNHPTGLTIDSAGDLYVADSDNDTIRKISSDGVVSTVVGTLGKFGFLPGPLPGVLHSPNALAIHGGVLYITFSALNGVAAVTNLPMTMISAKVP